jgi:hypothetical protein
MSSSTPQERQGLRFSPWNLLLLLPFLKTRDEVNPGAPGEDLDVDELDEGTRR